MPARPQRVKIRDELGRPQSLPAGPEFFAEEGEGDRVLVLGLGPDIGAAAARVGASRQVMYLEAPGIANQMPAPPPVPPTWQPTSAPKARTLLPCRRLIYTPGLRLFPSFWYPLLAHLRQPHHAPQVPSIWLPGPPHGLIRHELAEAASDLGLLPWLLPADLPPASWRQLLATHRPLLVLAINFHGFDPWGETQAILEAAGVPLVVWCVDNPFHLLSGIKTRAWKRLLLAVSDPWFVRPLRELGGQAIFLPLATSPTLFAPRATTPTEEVLFVGRTVFPDHERFFAAAHPSQPLLRRSRGLAPSRTAHWGWWWEQEGRPRLWPGQAARSVGAGAATCALAWRTQVLTQVARSLPLTLVGDAQWRSLMPDARLLPPVDYYAGLADYYAQAAITLNLTSLLLPHGLTQRHFDVWACGGFLLTDNSPGLRLFPRHLTDPITFTTPGQAVDLCRRYLSCPQQRSQLTHTWREHILQHHTYAHRLAHILDIVGIRPLAQGTLHA
jgi:hypothetical protein